MWFLWIVLLLIALCALYVFLMLPKLPRRPLNGLDGHLYAHRGLWTRYYPENSMPAFLNAVEHGYGIELDVHLTADGELAVFHDDDLQRMCGVARRISECTLAELSQYRLTGSMAGIPRFEDALRLVNGRVPLIIELKADNGNAVPLSRAVFRALEKYKGSYCIESFDPQVVRWWKLYAPNVVRGLLACSVASLPREEVTAKSYLMESLAHCVLARPDFIAYDFHHDNTLPMKLMRRLRPSLVAWTVRTPEELEQVKARYDLVIFEGFMAEK